ncbi:MAG: cytochrome P450 [Synechococcus sp. ELA057]
MPDPGSIDSAQPPVYPAPQPYTANILRRLRPGLRSWFALLNEWDFRVPLGRISVMGRPLFLVNEPALVRQVLVDQVERYPKHPLLFWLLQPLIGRGLFSVNGEEWARQRRLVDQAFQVAQLRRVVPQMQGAVAALLERLEAVGEGEAEKEVDIEAEMTLVTADVIVRTIVSRPLAAAEAAAILRSFQRYQRRAGQALVLRLLRLPGPLLQRYLAHHARPIRRWIQAVVEERLAAPATSAPPPRDLLQALLEARDGDTNSGFSAEELVDQVCVLFLAGHETSASALAMAAYLLARFPAAQDRLRREVEAALGGEQRPLGFDDLRLLPYGTAVFNETLRLYPPLSFFIREAAADGQLGESRCPMASLLTVSPWVIQRHERHWSDPHSFRPERFLAQEASEEERRWAREAWLPFGLGPRKCPGAAFALQESLLVLGELVRRQVLLPSPDHTPDLVGRLTLRSRNGIRLRLRPLRS